MESEQLRPLCLLQDDAMEDFTGLDTTNPNAVVVGLAPDYFTYEHLNQAFRLSLKIIVYLTFNPYLECVMLYLVQ